MPKIRKKQYLKINGDFIKKSGILTRSLKNITKKNNDSKSYFTYNKIHNDVYYNNNSIPFDDNNTNLFVVKEVNPVLSIEEKYKDKSTVLHTPNEFNTDYKLQKLVIARNYNELLAEDYLTESIEFNSYDDCSIEQKEDLKSNKEKINISLAFENPCRLSFNKLTSDDNESVVYDNENYKAYNAPVAYYDFTNKKWDHLGYALDPISTSDVFDFLDERLCFNSISTENVLIENSVLGIPINTFGFPFAGKFQGAKRHELSASDFIHEPFELNNIIINFIGSLKSEVENNLDFSVLNSLNFFILNQRNNLNEDSFFNLDLNRDNVEYYDANQNSEETIALNRTIKNNTFSVFTDTNEPEENFTNNTTSGEASQRELVAYLSLVNFSKNKNKSFDQIKSNIDYEKIKESADFFYEDNNITSNLLNANCSYDRVNFKIKSSVKTPIYRKKIESISSLNIYPFSKYYNRTGTEYNTERSEKVDFTKDENIITQTDEFGVSLEIGDSLGKENGYIIHPSDRLILGVSFNPGLKYETGSKLNKDIFVLLDKVDITLIGNYKRTGMPIRFLKRNYNLKNSKKINYNSSKNAVDQIGLSNIYLNKGAYYDKNINFLLGRYYRWQNSLENNKENSTEVVFDIPNVYSTAYDSFTFFRSTPSLWKPRTFINFQKNFLDNETIILQSESSLETETYKLSFLGNNISFSDIDTTFLFIKELTEDKQYILDVSHPSMTGTNIKFSEWNQIIPNNPSIDLTTLPIIYESEGIEYLGTPGQNGAHIKIEPRKFNLKSDLQLFFINFVNPLSQFHFRGQSVIIKSNSKSRNFRFFNYRSFGQPSNMVKAYKYTSYYDNITQKNYYTIKKRYKNIYLEAVSSPTITHNTDIHCKLNIPAPFNDTV